LHATGAIEIWEPNTGVRYPESQINDKLAYRTIDCIFNDSQFLANIQPSNSLQGCDFDFDDKKKWKHLSIDAVNSIKRYLNIYF